MQAVSSKLYSVEKAGPVQAAIISQLAYQIWPETYRFLPPGQVPYMLEAMYSKLSLEQQMQQGQHFLLLYSGAEPVGFSSYSIYPEKELAKLNKLYVLPSLHGQGLGRLLLREVERLVAESGCSSLFLNVNRHNPALAFYRRMGFEITREEDIPIGPFFMNDYVMEKSLATSPNSSENGISLNQ